MSFDFVRVIRSWIRNAICLLISNAKYIISDWTFIIDYRSIIWFRSNYISKVIIENGHSPLSDPKVLTNYPTNHKLPLISIKYYLKFITVKRLKPFNLCSLYSRWWNPSKKFIQDHTDFSGFIHIFYKKI